MDNVNLAEIREEFININANFQQQSNKVAQNFIMGAFTEFELNFIKLIDELNLYFNTYQKLVATIDSIDLELDRENIGQKINVQFPQILNLLKEMLKARENKDLTLINDINHFQLAKALDLWTDSILSEINNIHQQTE